MSSTRKISINSNTNKRNNNSRRRNNNPRNRRKLVNRRPRGTVPLAYRRTTRRNNMKVKRITSNMQTIVHREFIGQVKVGASTNFSIAKTVQINPGLQASFPWISSIAKNYESYRFNSLNFEYVPMVSATSTGKVMMFVDYDALDDPPTNDTTLLNSAGAVSTQVWSNVVLRSMPEQMNKAFKSKFIRTGSVPSGSDLKTYDAGMLYVATSGATANSVIGDIYANYSVDLLTPQLNDAVRTDTSQSFKTIFGTSTSPFMGGIEEGIKLTTKKAGTSWDRFEFNEAGKYLIEFAGRAMKANDNGKFDGGQQVQRSYNLYNAKLPNQGFLIEKAIDAHAGDYFDIQGSGSLDTNQYKDNGLWINKLSNADFDRLTENLLLDTSGTFTGVDYVDYT